MPFKYEKVAFGGTFDLPIHKGHEALISKAFEVGEFVIIGLTTDRFLLYSRKEDFEMIKKYEMRKGNLVAYLNRKGYFKRYKITPLHAIYRKEMIKERDYVQAIVVSVETFPNAMKINKLREKNRLDPLDIVQIPMVLAEDGLPISSTRIRRGEITPDGKLYRKA
jgi:pantetheine-phosphate adenylyltransferase